MSAGAAQAIDKRAERVAATPNGAHRPLVGGIASAIDDARCAAARSVNAAMTTAYWLANLPAT